MSAGCLYGCVEAGGTKFILGVARDADTILRTRRIDTTAPSETIGKALAFFAAAEDEWGAFDAFGIGTFGPVNLDRDSPEWGRIADTPKPGWSGTDLVGPFARRFGCPVALETDVNGAVLAEFRWGAAAGADVATYVTVGTGIGGGVLIAGHPVHGNRHPEMGHMLPRRHPADQDFAGICPFHRDCMEGLASGPAIFARWGASLSDLPADHTAHDIIAFYLAQLVVAQQSLLAPNRIVLGGGVLATPGLIDRIRIHADRLGAGYFGRGDIAQLIVAPGLAHQAGLLGALAIAEEACR